MNILLWALQVILSVFAVSGSLWRISHYAEAAETVASVGALPYGAWCAIGAFEVLCALGLLFGGFFKLKPSLTVIAAAALSVEMLLVSGLHLRSFGLQPSPANPAMWTIVLAVLAAFVAYGRSALKPF